MRGGVQVGINDRRRINVSVIDMRHYLIPMTYGTVIFHDFGVMKYYCDTNDMRY